MEDGSVDAVVTDPPYGLSFMGKKWDYDVPSVKVWQECLRVLKPGGYLLAFAGTRTQHRMAVRIEDAGFEIRDMIAWVYGSGFPKSLNLGDGRGTALKPALEPITVARKPLAGTVAANVQRYGTGVLNIDDCRVEVEGARPLIVNARRSGNGVYRDGMQGSREVKGGTNAGRWPANFIHDGSDEVLESLPTNVGAASPVHKRRGDKFRRTYGRFAGQDETGTTYYGGRGSAARLFYCAKSSRGEREAGLEGMEPEARVYNGQSSSSGGLAPGSVEDKFTTSPARNNHPTVKPIALMRYLVRLVTPQGGLVLDPFAGSGTTGCAAVLEGRRFVGIERERRFVEIGWKRMAYWAREKEEMEAGKLPLFAQLEEE